MGYRTLQLHSCTSYDRVDLRKYVRVKMYGKWIPYRDVESCSVGN